MENESFVIPLGAELEFIYGTIECKIWGVDDHVYEMKGDTVYNGKTWKKLSIADVRLYNDGTYELKGYFICFCREDNHRVYFLNPTREDTKKDSIGILFMDFNAQ